MSNQTKFDVASSDKLGLALSGGGFRAALFHIGTLARLAELDLLKHVQVLSTVSGGSIIGAMYYLKLKQLLEQKRPDGLTPSKVAYIKLVEELEEEFLQGVQTNIRVRILLNPFKSAKFLLSDDFSRSDRLSELYHETFYRPVWNPGKVSFWNWLLDVFCMKDSRAIFLKELKIYPPGTQIGFDIHDYNKTAEYKIPMLSINATTLNSGEHWTFTASSVGVQDKPGDNHPSLTLYPQLYFGDASLSQTQRDKLDSLTLSDAVAASACVPALFTPLPIHDLYPPIEGDEVVVELVDGGVFDNQGLATLKDEKCTHILCSDASGQLQFDRTPSSKDVSVQFRSNNVLMERIRGLETEDLTNGPTTGFWHLRDGFQPTPYFPAFSGPADTSDNKSNGQIFLLSAIRTDLDAFSDIEAHALM
ncbi:MAG: patatin-like phospholipase family protein, partial [Gammaproteobacteria bacterium]